MFPVTTSVPALPGVHYPDVCTNKPSGNKAFCSRHLPVAIDRGYPTSVRDFRQYLQGSQGLLVYVNIGNVIPIDHFQTYYIRT